jgi:hypothetical protein
VTDPVTIGSAVVAYIEPAAGEAAAFNAWYERDHFYAAAMAGPGMYAGARWVATRACKDARLPGRIFGDPARGSYLATYWLLPGMQGEWDDWAARAYAATPPERLFAGREHLHTAVYAYDWDRRAGNAPPPATALDHGFQGVVAIATTGDPREWVDDLVDPDLPLAVGFDPQRVIMSSANPEPHTLVLGFCTGDPFGVWPRVAPVLANRTDIGFASPFLRTIPGTDTYVDEL